MLITGRMTADAVVSTTKNDKEFVKFTVAVDESYKPKNGEKQKFVTYINCAYWFGTGVAKILRKGDAVSVEGRLSVRPWMSGNNEARAALDMFVTNIKAFPTKKAEGTATEQPVNTTASQAVDDLPF